MSPSKHGAAVVCGGGLLGRTIAALLRRSWPTTVVDTRAEVAGQLPDRVGFHHGNLTDGQRLRQELPEAPAVCVYAAGSLPPAFAEDPVAAHQRSLDAFTGFLSYTTSLVRPTRVVLCSSLAVYGRHTSGATEQTPAAPVTSYGRHKAAVESMLGRVAPVAGLSCAVLRYCGIVGPVTQAGGGWMHRALTAAATGRPSDGQARARAAEALSGHEYLHVQDAARAVVRAARHGTHGVWNIGSGAVPDREEVHRALNDLANGPRTTALPGAPAVPPDEQAAVTGLVWSKARKELGYEPEYRDFSSILESVVRHDDV